MDASDCSADDLAQFQVLRVLLFQMHALGGVVVGGFQLIGQIGVGADQTVGGDLLLPQK